jgi:hypothetical protein
MTPGVRAVECPNCEADCVAVSSEMDAGEWAYHCECCESAGTFHFDEDEAA